MSTVFLSARWSHLAMLSWPVDPALLRPLVPAGTELDLRDGAAWASVVGFRFRDTRLRGWPVPFHRDFDEVNLRFYLRRRAPGGWERGVGFVRELVPRRAIAWVARACYNEPYRALPMASAIAVGADGSTIAYRWRLERWHGFRVATAGPPAPADPAGRDGWIAEHYWGWTRQRDGGTVAYRVEHPPWRLQPARLLALDADLGATYGAAWGAALAGPPPSLFVAEGSAVTVGVPQRLP